MNCYIKSQNHKMPHKEPEPQNTDCENTPNYSTDIGDEV